MPSLFGLDHGIPTYFANILQGFTKLLQWVYEKLSVYMPGFTEKYALTLRFYQLTVHLSLFQVLFRRC